MASLPPRRPRRASTLDARERGFAAALGDPVDDERRDDVPVGRTCRTCGATGRLDMVDATVQRAYLSCPRCGHNWDTDRLDVIVDA